MNIKVKLNFFSHNKFSFHLRTLLVEKRVICDKRKSMIVSDNVIQAEGLSDFFKNLGKKVLNVSRTLAKIVLNNPSRALDITAKVATEILKM